MITISLNKELDKEVLKDFWGFSVSGADFGTKIIKDHSLITLENHEQYIDEYYATHISLLNENVREVQLEINHTSADFFGAVQKIFQEDFSQHKYEGFFVDI